VRLIDRHAHNVTITVLIVLGVLAVIGLVVWPLHTRRLSAEELHLRRADELLARFDELTLFEIRAVFSRLANGTMEEQDCLEAALEPPEDVPEPG